MNVPRRNQLLTAICDFILQCPMEAGDNRDSSLWESRFNRLTVQLFRYQFEHNLPYQKLCLQRLSQTATITRWQNIPAVMTSSFKVAPLFCGDAQTEANAVYHTSGTTKSRPGKHYFKTTELYELAAMRAFRWACLPDIVRLPILVLGPTRTHFPNSSLGQMFSWIVQKHGSAESEAFFSPSGLHLDGAVHWLTELCAHRQPVLLLATSLALLEFVEHCQKNKLTFRLPAESRILDTGGYKGTNREITRSDFLRSVAHYFHIPPASIFNEYGMTEMSSQFYETQFTAAKFGEGVKVAPPWVRSMACDPDTLTPLAEGQPGVLRHFDLANLDSVAMLQTADFGIVRGRTIELLGRDPNAEPRGCSLLADELEQAS